MNASPFTLSSAIRRLAVTMLFSLALSGVANAVTPLGRAAKAGDVAAINRMIDAGADVDAGEYGTPLHMAAAFGQVPAIEVLLAAYADVDAVTPLVLFTPLHLAAMKGHPAAVKVLLDAGADVNARSWSGQTPLSLAREGMDDPELSIVPLQEVIEILEAHGARE